MERRSTFIAFIPALLLAPFLCGPAGAQVSFQRVEIDAQPPQNPWVKIAGDINGDGRPDVVIGGQKGPLVWYANPAWTRTVISDGGYSTVGGTLADIDGDGDLDAVLGGLFWYENPRPAGDPSKGPWRAHQIAKLRGHDVEAADLNGDGKLDVILRDQSGFGAKTGNRVVLFYQVSPDEWTRREIPCPHGEGLKVIDLDGDGSPDVVTGARWYRNPGRSTEAAWKEHILTRRWEHEDAKVAVADFNGDGRVDVALAPAEYQGGSYRIAWYEAPRDPRSGAEWVEHVIDSPVETVVHALNAADMNGDGTPDLVAASMHQGRAPQEVRVYLNKRSGSEWEKQIVSTRGSHDTVVVDLDGDGALDIIGANHGGPYQPVEWWRNTRLSPEAVRPAIKGPKPGDLYREFYVVMSGGKDWRVTDPEPEHKGALEFLPNSVLRLNVSTLFGATRAELLIDRWGGHTGTTGQRIRFNNNAWIDVPQLKTTPPGESPLCYLSQDNTVVDVPLADLKEGENTLEGTAGDQSLCNGFGWGQWGWYGAILRVYYDSAPHTKGRVVSPRRGGSFGENPLIRVETEGEADRVDVLAWYDGYDEDGDGVFEDWHGAYHYIDLQHHAGSSTRAPHVIRWDTTWVPDQRPGAVKLIARIRSREGVWYVTPIVDGLTLKRKGSVKFFRPGGVPLGYHVRAGARKSSWVEVSTVEGAVGAVVALRTWNGYHERFTFNGQPVDIAGADHNYALGLRPVPLSAIRPGKNIIEFHSTTEHHGPEILWPGPGLLVRYAQPAASLKSRNWLNADYEGRFSVEITADSRLVSGTPVEMPLPSAVSARHFRVVEYQDGDLSRIRNGALPWQLDAGKLLVLLPGVEAGRPKRLMVYFGKDQGWTLPGLVAVEDNVMHSGQASLRVSTPRATYVYHKEGGGFASIFDSDGNDWISYRQGGGSAGEYRGIPNLGECFHPGYKGAQGSRTTVESAGPLRARFRSETADGRYAAAWDIYPAFARMTVERAGGPYWFLYEGTPGGRIDVPEDFWVTSDGERRSVAESLNADLKGPEWVYFGDSKLNRALFVANHQDDTANDQFWQMESNMTVWGFGREFRCCGRYLTAAPAQFTIGLLETKDYARAAAEIGSALAVPKVVVGDVELLDSK